ncbi:MAG TPA: flotillin-like protein FloA [Patescibacteria group bacterium]|nr:flotillin-like protein FloA [Patescibacteria group bacterium]
MSLSGIGLFFIVFGIIILILLFFYFVPIGLWITAYFSGVKVRIFRDLIGMRLRKVPPLRIIRPKIAATKAGIDVEIDKMEAHYLAGGNVQNVINALISANKANINLDFERATAIDLAGRDVLEAVKMSVNPKVIVTPMITAVAMDGIQVRATSRVTVRANIERLVGGAGEETVIARVGEGIVTTIGSATSHKKVLENPDRISKTVLEKGLDSGTAFEILSIDIADVDVGANIGAKLQADQAEADKRIAQAKAEERRALAVAIEQEMKARVVEMRAKVVEAEAEIPRAISEAFRQGNLGIMDYYNLRNIQADTDMRKSIAQPGKEQRPGQCKE